MINRYDTVIIVIDRAKNKMLALKFKIIDGHLNISEKDKNK